MFMVPLGFAGPRRSHAAPRGNLLLEKPAEPRRSGTDGVTRDAFRVFAGRGEACGRKNLGAGGSRRVTLRGGAAVAS
ncbi:hypothetical protein PSMK_10530 [Phycisphaera mikurensis NBRC 102666]|uniref:Uncharacterized protein n=1 Tax=Phycisphaera mikurensis (strain NBRC 102666 / KCTC 22515 / FYK2301M01) TaxID=1142394 RepID=I0ID74_PHYMF|nr:hypothetical protein PSMK_10530 [Phycisphaera mikurensis NBRC 102666]